MTTPPGVSYPKKACHNCRQKRWQCDRSLPACRKCLSSGSECLGYGKLFVWNDGVASRGKMMGKSFEETKAATTSSPTKKGTATTVDAGLGDALWISSLPCKVVQYAAPPGMRIQWPLVDPIYQDLDPNSRYYLFHFATRLSADMVIYDTPAQTPLHDLIPAASAYPLLRHIIIANSAVHVFNISRDPIDASAYQEAKKPCHVAYYAAVSCYSGPIKTSYKDALIAKSHALSLLAQSVATVDETNIDIILVTILLFIYYDLLESGKDKWRVHMDGGRKLIKLLGKSSYRPHAMGRLRTHLLADFLVFYILGSTFCFSTVPNLFPPTIDLDPILQYAESNNYLSCPAPLLRVMLKSFSLTDLRETSDDLTPVVQEQIRDLLQETINFDPNKWILGFQPTSPFDDLEKRVLMALAHRSAVCIYLARFVPCTNPLLNPSGESAVISLTGLADDIVFHISQLKPSDNMFKCISWPLFLAGAESEDPAQRTWIMDTFDDFYSVMYWGYVHTVKKVLDAIWHCRDNAPEGSPNCWVNEVKDMRTQILIA